MDGGALLKKLRARRRAKHKTRALCVFFAGTMQWQAQDLVLLTKLSQRESAKAQIAEFDSPIGKLAGKCSRSCEEQERELCALIALGNKHCHIVELAGFVHHRAPGENQAQEEPGDVDDDGGNDGVGGGGHGSARPPPGPLIPARANNPMTPTWLLLTRFCAQGTVADVLETLTAARARLYLSQLLSALVHVHAHGFVHRDLKLANLFLSTPTHLRLGDFGCVTTIDARAFPLHPPKSADETEQDKRDEPRHAVPIGCPATLAPEVVQRQPLTTKSDVWATGACFYKMLTQDRNPFPGRTVKTYARNVVLHRIKDMTDLHALDALVVTHLMVASVADRPTAGAARALLLSQWPGGFDRGDTTATQH